jgi:hypothetical protein
MDKMKLFKKEQECRICREKKIRPILNLGNQPLANNLQKRIETKEFTVPLIIGFCNKCKLVQLTHTVNPNVMFKKYVWVTGTSDGARLHSQNFYKMAQKRKSSEINKVLEIASNDGTFLKPFKKNNIFTIGVDPAKNISSFANKKGIKTLPIFFNYKNSIKIKKQFGKFDFIFARNVLPHTPIPLEIIKGIKEILHEEGFGAIEFHYSKKILDENQYDSIYHEHFFYYSVKNVRDILEKFSLYAFDTQESPISGGSMILYFSTKKKKISEKLNKILKVENKKRINTFHRWKIFAKKSKNHRGRIIKLIKKYPQVYAYGASARSSTMLNYCGISFKNILGIFDKNNLKHNLYTPGSKIKIINPLAKAIRKSNSLIILSWNFYDEIYKFLKQIKYRGTIIKPLPSIKVVKL